MTPWVALLPFLVMSGSGIEAPPEAESWRCLAERLADQDRDLHRRYLYETNGRQGIRGFEEDTSNASILIPGSDRLVLLWHGFMASPPEMEPLGRFLHRALGATIYIPLVPGFGSGHEVADKFDLDAWRTSMREVIEVGTACSGELALVGYSIGGGLVADFLLSSTLAASNSVRSVVLLSPYIETAGWMAPALRARPRAGFMHGLRSVLRLRSLRLETLYRWSRSRYRDLEVLLAHPEIYDRNFSLKAGLNMLRLTRRLRSIAPDAASELPTLLAYSEADRTVGWAFTHAFVERHFPATDPVIRYPASDRIPHQIVVPEVNSAHQELFAEIAGFLERHFEAPG